MEEHKYREQLSPFTTEVQHTCIHSHTLTSTKQNENTHICTHTYTHHQVSRGHAKKLLEEFLEEGCRQPINLGGGVRAAVKSCLRGKGGDRPG